MLASYPNIADKVREEADAVLSGDFPTFELAQKLSYTKRVLQESMRLYPPVWSVSRIATQDNVLNDFLIPKNAYLYLSIYAVHRHPDFWENPDQFDPDRFSTQRMETQHKQAYLPFGAGPHICIGREFAMLSMQLIVAQLVKKYQFHLVPGFIVEKEPLITLRPKFGMQLRVSDRAKEKKDHL